MNRRTCVAAALSLGLLGGCVTNGVTATYVYNDPIYSPDWFSYAASGRDLRVIVRGNPTAAGTDRFGNAVITAMNERHTGPRTNFTMAPSDSARKSFRVVMLFGSGYVSERVACADPEAAPVSYPGGPISLNAAFCHGERPLNAVRVTVNSLSSPDDPVLGDMVSTAMRQIFPQKDFNQQNDPTNPFES